MPPEPAGLLPWYFSLPLPPRNRVCIAPLSCATECQSQCLKTSSSARFSQRASQAFSPVVFFFSPLLCLFSGWIRALYSLSLFLTVCHSDPGWKRQYLAISFYMLHLLWTVQSSHSLLFSPLNQIRVYSKSKWNISLLATACWYDRPRLPRI